jgi:ABC-type sugar transport system ATPase subunit
MTPAEAHAAPFLEVRTLCKRFGSIQALDNVSFDISKGEIHGLVGANGAGKSTLIRTLAGVYQPDSGAILIDGAPVSIRRPAEAAALGLNFIHQELNLVPKLTALQNLMLGLPKPKKAGLFIDWKAVEHQVTPVVSRLNMQFSLHSMVTDLSTADLWLLSIGRALVRQARLIAMDEPTASLSEEETHRLFSLISDLARSGVTILYVSHRLNEITELSDRVTVFRDGRLVASLARTELNHRILVREIAGRDIGTTARPPAQALLQGTPMIEVRRLTRRPAVRDVSFAVHGGEVVGLAGLVGAGRTEVARLIFGADRPESGEIRLDGVQLGPLTPHRAVRAGIALVPEERRSQGLVLNAGSSLNVSLSSLEALRLTPRMPLISKRRSRERALGQIKSLDIKVGSPETPVRQLSGGNQQKVVVSKWLVRDARVIMLDEPTKGVDVSARAEIYRVIRRLAADGRAVIVISSEFGELALCCDRVLVMAEGRIVGSLTSPNINEGRMLEMSYGTESRRDQ